MVHAVLREQMVTLVHFLGFLCAQLVVTRCLIQSANQIRVGVVRLCTNADVESQDRCHEDLEVLCKNSFTVVGVALRRQLLGLFLLACAWL